VGQLHQVEQRLVWMLAAFALAVPTTGAESYCSLRVRVLYPDGQRADALVSVEEKSGRVQRQRQEATDLRFCDLGVTPVTVKVGVDGTCNQVIVRNVPLAWNVSNLLTVTYDVDPCLVEKPPPPVPLCRTVFRIADSSGKWLVRAPIRISTPTPAVLLTDGFGRASFLAKAADEIAGSVEAPGYAAVEFRITCTRSEPVHEEDIRLKPAERDLGSTQKKQ
jgi:hypothetical protein